MLESKSTPLVSVLLPAYNCEATLESAVKSMTSQTLRDIEVIVVNDGSKDGTGALLDRLAEADPRIRPVHTANGGIVKALNTALSLARGEFVARMDGDDLSHPERLARQVDYLREHADCVCVATLFRLMDAEGRITEVQNPIRNFSQTDLGIFPPRVTTLPHPSILVRRSVLVEMGGYRSGFQHAEDYDLYLRLSERGQLGMVQSPLLDYRVHAGSLSSRNLIPQVDSALRALVCAYQRRRGLPELRDDQVLAARELTQAVGDDRLARLLFGFRQWRIAEALQMREGRRAALSQLARLFMRQVVHLPVDGLDRGYWALHLKTLKLGVKVVIGRV